MEHIKGKVPALDFHCVLHGSFQRHFEEIQRIRALFMNAGIKVLAPDVSRITEIKDGFAILSTNQERDPRIIELRYLHNLKRLGEGGFSYFVNPDGYMGKSVSYELGIAQISNVRCFFLQTPVDHPAYIHGNAVWKPELFVEYIAGRHTLPEPDIKQNEKIMHGLWEDLIVAGSVVAVGGIIEYQRRNEKKEKEILLVKTHKWGGLYSIIGGRIRRNERLRETLVREVREESGLKATVGRHICTFDQIKNSGYYQSGIHHIFVDNVVQVTSKRVQLNDEAQDYVWTLPRIALKELPIEPNARHTVELYATMSVGD